MTTPDIPNGHRSADIQFSATPWGYTKLWLVNLLLTLATLGIYGAWAKVRNNQYLYGHTNIEGHRLQYLAKPLQILQGRLLALGVLLIIMGVSYIEPMAAVVAYLILLALSPWLIVQGLKFTYRNTSYRNVRFDFKGSYIDAFVNFILLPVLSVFTLFLAFPWVMKRIHQFMFGNCEYGGERLTLNTSAGEYYKASAAVVGAYFVLFIALSLAFGGTMALLAGAGADPSDAEAFSQQMSALIFPFIAAFYALPYLLQALFSAMIRNHIVNNLSAEDLAQFKSNITVGGYLSVAMTNALLILFTLGLGYPAAKVRKMRYLASKTQVELSPRIDHMANQVDGNDSAFGEEAAGVFDTDLSII